MRAQERRGLRKGRQAQEACNGRCGGRFFQAAGGRAGERASEEGKKLPLQWENRLFDDLVTLLRVSFSYIDVHTQQRIQMCYATCCPHSKPNPFGGSVAACRPAPTQNLTRAWWPPNDSHRKQFFSLHIWEHVHPVSIPTCSLRSPSSFTFPTEILCRKDQSSFPGIT